MFIGAHVSTAGGLKTALQRGQEIGAESIQIFPSAPLRWKINGWSDEDCAWFKEEWPKHFQQVIFHGIYLTNLAAESGQNFYLTKHALTDTLNLANKLGIIGTVFHPGSYVEGKIGRQDRIKETIAYILKNAPGPAKLIYENSAGGTIGAKLEDLAWLIANSPDKDRVGVCLDTCHAFAAGYDISTEQGYKAYVNEVDKIVGLDKVFCWHFNDSKFGLGEKRDRHENIGDGQLGQEAFRYILNDQRWQKHSSYLEVPGLTKQGPDKANINRLIALRSDG